MSRSKADYENPEAARKLYESLLMPRLIEEKMINLLRQGKISKWFSGIGQEAIAVGTAHALNNNDFVLPMHRNLGLFTTRGISLYKLFCQWLGKTDGYTQGRDRSFHFGSMEHRIIGMISHLGANLPVADGLALAAKIRQEDTIALAFCGDGATSEGDFHEALNLAAVWKLPVVFLIENNGYGLSTPVSEQYACKSLYVKAQGYGIQGIKIDGNDIFEVMNAVSESRQKALEGLPVLIEAETFRMKGHEEASGTFYVPDEKFKQWAEKDPVHRLEIWLENKHSFSDSYFKSVAEKLKRHFQQPLERALKAKEPTFDKAREIQGVFAPSKISLPQNGTEKMAEKRMVDAFRDALCYKLKEDELTLILGQDIAEYGGVFKVTEGFYEEFGKERIRNTPIIESGAIGAALGLALNGFKPIVEMQFADFISCGFNQVINNLAKGHYRWMPPLNVTIRCPHGAGVGAGPFHSQSPEGWFMQHAGLKIGVPATVKDAQDMLYTAIHEPNPMLIFEHKKLYRSIKNQVPERPQLTAIGQAAVQREGKDATIVTYGQGLHWALQIAERMSDENIDIEVVDLRWLCPIDMETVEKSVRKTNRVLLLQEPSATMGPMSEIAAGISEQCFELLDAPVIRCSSLDTPVPFHPKLEEGYLANSSLEKKLHCLLSY